ncbi:beta-galactosidase [Dictyobacter halimunensis]|uniref:beta-galactosidase n=1 Tax=Dictyobacter halimunensis TaxID=3026934 RepID=UPI0030C73FC8
MEIPAAVSYDSRAILINGERTLIVSGAIHYPRSTPAMWPELMRQSKEAGLNTIETYVFWNLHEQEQGKFDFSDRLNLFYFCELAERYGLHVILRIGPYICAETNYGGLPSWLREVPSIAFRTYNQPFMREMERWVRFLVDYIRPLLASHGGPIILAQLENEYENIASRYGAEGQRYLRWVSELGQSLNMGIPLVMCVGAAEGAIETMNGFYAHPMVEQHALNHPDQPAIWTEDWPGWYDTFGYPHHIRTPQDVAYGVARFIAAGGTGVNYYMWHGGTNFGREAMYLQTTSYDFNAPLNEFGQPTTKSRHLADLHQVLHSYARLLLEQERPQPQPLGEQQWAYTYASETQALTFLCNDAPLPASCLLGDEKIELPAHSVLLVGDGVILYNTAEVDAAHTLQLAYQPLERAITRTTWYVEPLPTQRPDARQRAITAPQPVEQLSLTHDRTDYCWYSTTLSTTEEAEGTLSLIGFADVAHIFVDSQFVATSPTPLLEDRGSFEGPAFTQSFNLSLAAGQHELSILSCAVGLIKGDWMIDANMVEERKGLWGHARWNSEVLEGEWSILPGLLGEQGALFGAASALVTWQKKSSEALNQPLRWWQLSFSRPQGEGPFVVDLNGMQKGLAWLNGRCIGRYWLTPASGETEQWQKNIIFAQNTDVPTQRYYHLPQEWLQEENILTLFEELGGDPDTIALCQVEAISGAQPQPYQDDQE